jgi:type III restriction enzyme
MKKKDEQTIPIQPVENPILCSPYLEPGQHWFYHIQTGIPRKTPGRRPASYWYKGERAGGAQLSLFAEETRDDLPLVNFLRDDVRRWRESRYENGSSTTKQLLSHWWRDDRLRRLFFCQLEAVETVIYIREILATNRKPRWKTKLTLDDYLLLMEGKNPRPGEWTAKVAQHPKLVDIPNEPDLRPLIRCACKMATGSGKTVVMAMLITWAFCNRGANPGDSRYPRRALVVCPNLTIKERLQVLRPEDPDNYYDQFDLVPSKFRHSLAKGKVLITNWHAFNPESEHIEGGKSYIVVNKGKETPEAFARNRLGDLWDDEPLMVFNDEGHHAYRPAPVGKEEKLTAEERADREEATVWVSGLDKINGACGIAFCVDLSATPFYIHGSGYPEGSPFPWIVSDFGLVDAIESGITKIPRLPAMDNTGRPDPKYYKLWEHITRDLKAGEKLTGGKPKPEVVYRKAEDALITLAGEWKERFEQVQAAAPGQERVPPVMILVCDNTSIADCFHRQISGEEMVDVDDVSDDDEDEEGSAKRKRKPKKQKRYGTGSVFPEYLSNRESGEVTLRIDSELLAEAESQNVNATRKEAAEDLRRTVATIGRPGEPGERVRCVVSVNMLSEGWDANNVTHILGLRAFGSQLLCEQVVGRGLRRMDYTPDPQTGLFTPEYVDIFGVPFSLIPFKGREPGKPQPEDRPKNEVVALPERRNLEIRFPIVEGYVVALKKNFIKCNVAATEPTLIDPWSTPTATFVRPQVGYQTGSPSAYSGFGLELVDREAYYASTHPQTVEFEIAREIVRALTDTAHPGKESLRRQSRSILFPQVLRVVQEYIRTRVDNPVHPCEIGLQTYAQRVVSLLLDAIQPDDAKGEAPLLPRLNRYKRDASTASVHFKTVKPVQATLKSHINFVACDTGTWEQAAMFQLESSSRVVCYARNERLEFNIPYELFGLPHVYEPDFLVKLTNKVTLILEIKGQLHGDTSAKHQAARRWVTAVNNWGKLGRWDFLACRDPQKLSNLLDAMAE